jgi:PAS domain S-box-containing protein
LDAAGLRSQACEDTRELGPALTPPAAALLVASAAILPAGAAHRLHHELQASYHRQLGVLLLATPETAEAAWGWLARLAPPGYAAVLVAATPTTLGAAIQIALAQRRAAPAAAPPGKRGTKSLAQGSGMVESEGRRLRALLDALPAAVVIVDALGRVRETSAATAQLLGAPVDDLDLPALARRFRAWRPDGLPLELEDWSLMRALRAGEVSSAEELIIQALDGRRKTILTNTLPIRDAADTITGAIAIAVDITSLKDAEQQLKAVNERLEERVAERTATVLLLHEVASAANRARSLEEALVLVLQPIARHHGWAFGQVLISADEDPDQLVPAAYDPPDMPAGLLRMRTATRVAALQRGTGQAGRVFATGRPEWTIAAPEQLAPARATVAAELALPFAAAFPVFAGAEVVAVLEFFGPSATAPEPRTLAAMESIGTQLGRVVERQRAEQLLRHAERLASLGTFAAGIAHEVNNPLTSILMTARFALKQLREPDEFRELLGEIIDDAERCARIVRNVLRFAKQEAGEKWPVTLNELVQRVVNSTRRTAEARDVTVQAVLADELPAVLGNATELEQALASLVANAVQVSRAGGEVQVRTSLAAGRVRIEIEDTGRGMSRHEIEHAFEPFFTTWAREGRTGLGLSLAHGIITEHGGQVDIQTLPGRGTKLICTLPAALPCDGGQA